MRRKVLVEPKLELDERVSNMDDRDQLEILFDLHKELAIIREHMGEVRTDLRVHIKRTAIIETELKFIHRQVWLAHGAIGLLALLGTVLTVWKLLPTF